MFLVIRADDDVIVASSTGILNEEELASRGRYCIEIPDEEYTDEMIGAIYNGGEEV